jgi:hypothetical protein
MLRVVLVSGFSGMFQQQSSEVKWADDDVFLRELSRQAREVRERPWGKRYEPALGPLRIGRPPTTFRHSETRLNVGDELQRSEVARSSGHPTEMLSAKYAGNLARRADLSFHALTP